MLFLSVRGFLDYAGPTGHSRLSRPTVLPSPLRQKVGILKQRFFEAQSPGPPIPLSTLRAPPHDVARKTRGQDGFAVLLSCRVGIELGRADVRQRDSSPALSVAEWVTSSAIATVPHAPLRRRMVGCPESGSDLGDAHKTFPMAEEFKCSVHMPSATPMVYFVRWFTLRGSVYSRLCVREPSWNRQVPRAPLPKNGLPFIREMSCISSEGITPPSSLLRTHAPDLLPSPTSGLTSCR